MLSVSWNATSKHKSNDKDNKIGKKIKIEGDFHAGNFALDGRMDCGTKNGTEVSMDF